MSHTIEILAALMFGLAVLHTFCVPLFARVAARGGPHAGMWHWLGEVESVFGLWAAALVLMIAALAGGATALAYVESRNFVEPLFVFAVMVVAASRPIMQTVVSLASAVARVLPVRRDLGLFWITLALVPLMGSLVTEPAAMTLAALMLRDTFFQRPSTAWQKTLVLGVLLVNVSIGGVLTAYAAPPVLMVAGVFGWDSAFMASTFGWRAAIAVVINASVATLVVRHCFAAVRPDPADLSEAIADPLGHRARVPLAVVLIHLVFLVGIVVFSHHPVIFLALLLFFIGYAHAYARHQDRLMIKEGLMVAFFLAGLVVLGGLQQWWLQDALGGMSPTVLFWGATALTAVTDNAALTYLGAQVTGTSEAWRYVLVAGAVTGGGLTVIANAPNPAAFAILKGRFPDEAIPAGRLFICALGPTLVAAFMFLLPV